MQSLVQTRNKPGRESCDANHNASAAGRFPQGGCGLQRRPRLLGQNAPPAHGLLAGSRLFNCSRPSGVSHLKPLNRRLLAFLLALSAVYGTFVPNAFAKPISISAVKANNISTDRVTITWTTSAPATSQVEYGTTTSYGTATPADNTLVTAHSVLITGLTPNVTYNFRVKSSPSANGTPIVSGNYAFKTLPIRYTIQFWDYANPGIYMMDMNNLDQVVGWNTRADGNVYGILYNTLSDTPLDLTDEYAGPGTGFEGWRIGSTSGLNDAGVMVGKIVDPSGVINGYLLDTAAINPTIVLLPNFAPPGTTIGYRRINNHRDILTIYVNPDGTYGAYLYNHDDYVLAPELVVPEYLPATIKPIRNSAISLNNATPAQVAGNLADGTAFLWTLSGGGVQTFPGLKSPAVRDVNDDGVLSGDTYSGKPSKQYPMRLSTSSLDLLTGAADHDGVSINSSSDVLLDDSANGTTLLLHHSNLGYLDLDMLVTGSTTDLGYWFGGTHKLWFLNNRDATGFGRIVGSIHFADGTNMPYTLIPVLP